MRQAALRLAEEQEVIRQKEIDDIKKELDLEEKNLATLKRIQAVIYSAEQANATRPDKYQGAVNAFISSHPAETWHTSGGDAEKELHKLRLALIGVNRELNAQIKLEVQKEKEDAKLANAAAKFAAGQKSFGSGFGSGSIKSLAEMFVGYKLLEFGKSIIETELSMQRMRNTMTAVTGSSALMRDEMQYVSQTADHLGLSIMETGTAYSQWLATVKTTELEGEKGRKVFADYSQAFHMVGLDAEQTANAFNTLVEAQSEGRWDRRLIRQLSVEVPGALRIMAGALHKTTQEFTREVHQGLIGSTENFELFGEAMKTAFSMEHIETGRISFMQLGNEWTKLKASLAEGGAFEEVQKGIDAISKGLKEATDNGTIKNWAEGFGTVAHWTGEIVSNLLQLPEILKQGSVLANADTAQFMDPNDMSNLSTEKLAGESEVDFDTRQKREQEAFNKLKQDLSEQTTAKIHDLQGMKSVTHEQQQTAIDHANELFNDPKLSIQEKLEEIKRFTESFVSLDNAIGAGTAELTKFGTTSLNQIATETEHLKARFDSLKSLLEHISKLSDAQASSQEKSQDRLDAMKEKYAPNARGGFGMNSAETFNFNEEKAARLKKEAQEALSAGRFEEARKLAEKAGNLNEKDLEQISKSNMSNSDREAIYNKAKGFEESLAQIEHASYAGEKDKKLKDEGFNNTGEVKTRMEELSKNIKEESDLMEKYSLKIKTGTMTMEDMTEAGKRFTAWLDSVSVKDLKQTEQEHHEAAKLDVKVMKKTGDKQAEDLGKVDKVAEAAKQKIWYDAHHDKEGHYIDGHASGTILPGYGGGDIINSRLEPGEAVIRKEMVRKYGAGFFRALNNGKDILPGFSDGMIPDNNGLSHAQKAYLLRGTIDNPALDKIAKGDNTIYDRGRLMTLQEIQYLKDSGKVMEQNHLRSISEIMHKTKKVEKPGPFRYDNGVYGYRDNAGNLTVPANETAFKDSANAPIPKIPLNYYKNLAHRNAVNQPVYNVPEIAQSMRNYASKQKEEPTASTHAPIQIYLNGDKDNRLDAVVAQEDRQKWIDSFSAASNGSFAT